MYTLILRGRIDPLPLLAVVRREFWAKFGVVVRGDRGAAIPPVSDARGRARELDAALGDVDWTVPARGSAASRFAAPSGDLAVVSAGDPAHPRVVLVPGVTGSKEDFVLMLPLLAEAGYFVQSIDLAGQYESHAAGASGPYTNELFVDDLVAFLEAGSPAHLLGYSFGGIVSQIVMAQRPELVRSLALLTTPPAVGNVFSSMKVVGPVAHRANGRVGAALLLWGVRWNLNRIPPKRLEFVRARFAYTNRRSVDEIIGLMMNAPDVRAELLGLPAPKLIAASTHDLWPVEAYEGFAGDIGAQLRMYDTGHSPCETTPHELVLDMLELYARAG